MSSVRTVMLVCKHMEASDVDAPSPLSVKRLDIMQTSWRFHTGLVKNSRQMDALWFATSPRFCIMSEQANL